MVTLTPQTNSFSRFMPHNVLVSLFPAILADAFELVGMKEEPEKTVPKSLK